MCVDSLFGFVCWFFTWFLMPLNCSVNAQEQRYISLQMGSQAVVICLEMLVY